MARFTELETYDVRFPTSLDLDGSDAMNTDPDYSAAYLHLDGLCLDAHKSDGRDLPVHCAAPR